MEVWRQRPPVKGDTSVSMTKGSLDNGDIAELLAREAMAFKRTCGEAFLWTEVATDLKTTGRSLTELRGGGPSIARMIHRWIEAPPPSLKPPELRAEFLTMARAHRVPKKNPQWRANLKGDLQMHTTGSDGSGSVADMAAQGIERGYEYIAITDLTKGLKIANGQDERRLKVQGKEIASVNQGFRKSGIAFTVLRSTEVNLSPVGEVDLDASTLAELDIVLGSFHSALRRADD